MTKLRPRGPTPTKIVCKIPNPMACLERFQTKIPVYKFIDLLVIQVISKYLSVTWLQYAE